MFEPLHDYMEVTIEGNDMQKQKTKDRSQLNM